MYFQILSQILKLLYIQILEYVFTMLLEKARVPYNNYYFLTNRYNLSLLFFLYKLLLMSYMILSLSNVRLPVKFKSIGR